MRFSHETREANLEWMAGGVFDLLVIGGGITGAGIAWDASLRGFRTALVEKEDFAAGTSGKSSRLIHGGLRYLQNLDLNLVFEASHERDVLRRIAPRLVRPLPFLFPLYRGSGNSLQVLSVGMALYDLLSAFRNVARHRLVRASQVLQLEPIVNPDGLLGAARYWDCAADDARLTLMVILAAHRAGAVVANHVEVTEFLWDEGRVSGARLHDRLRGRELEARAHVVVNATGPWVDAIRRLDAPGGAGSAFKQLRLTKGIHLVVPRDRAWSEHAVVFSSPRDGRWLFLIPWGTLSIIGTTETDFAGDLDAVQADPDDVDYVLEAFARAFPEARLSEADVMSTYAGVRPLVDDSGRWAYRVSREHRVFESPSGLISIAGGKLTTFRVMARDVVDLAARRLAERFGITAPSGCRTHRVGLANGEGAPGHARVDGRLVASRIAAQLDADVLAHLLTAYGAGAERVLALVAEDAGLGERIVPGLPYLRAEVPYAVQHEMAMTLTDFLARRARVIQEDVDQGLSQARSVAELMAEHLGWSPAETAAQVQAYEHQVALTQGYRQRSPGY